MSLTAGRKDERTNRKFNVWLSPGSEPMFAELAWTENVSSCGVRVRTEVAWKPNTRLFVKLPQGGVWTRARIAYCQKLGESHVLGLEFHETSYRYNLTFRCIHCGRHKASANFRSDRVERQDQIISRIYSVQCAGCGWKGEVCGFSAAAILRYKSLEMGSPELDATLGQQPLEVANNKLGRERSQGAA